MYCPKCNKEMKKGYIQTVTSGGMCWVKKPHTILPPYVDEEYMELGDSRLILPVSLKGYNCTECKIVVADYSNSYEEI